MVQKLLKKSVRRIVPRKSPVEEVHKTVLVGTYKGDQLESWAGYYNYPILPKDKVDIESAKRVNEIWLFKGARGGRFFAADFVGRFTRDELKSKFGYPAKGRGHGDSYLLYRISRTEIYNPAKGLADAVIVRASDFATTPKVRKQIKAYLESPERKDPIAANLVPKILTQVPPPVLRVCDAAVQLDFLSGLNEVEIPSKDYRLNWFEDLGRADLYSALRIQPIKTALGFTHVDCFSGVGGFCTGLHAAGFSTRLAIEKIRSCVETYCSNHPEVRVINDDICHVGFADISPFIPCGGIDLVTSGMPCETFSTAGNTSRSFYDERQFLFREGIRIAQLANAKFLLFENVPAITTKTVSKDSPELVVDVLKKELVEAGYRNYIEVVLDATKFGVPQKRKRYFILATRLGNIVLRRPTTGLIHAFTVGDAFADLPAVVPNSWVEGSSYNGKSNAYTQLMRNDTFWRRTGLQRDSFRVTYQMPMKHRPATLERFSLLGQGQGLRDLFERYSGQERIELQKRHVLPKKVFIKRNFRLPENYPAPTVTSHCLDEFVHPSENRALTVRECARLQSFPDSYDFVGGPYIVPHIDREVQDKYEQIGDAVPPLLAYAWGRVISEMLQEVQR